jgi:hypothetical protein
MDEKINASIKKIKEVLELNLSIPDFQRPYCWKESNVRLLLQDVYDSWKSGKQSYRIGSSILYKPENEDKYLIVDGQQRITTIILILNTLNNNFLAKKLCSELKYEHLESQQNILNSHTFITKWITEKIANEKEEFYKYLVEYCEFVEIIVSDLSEAFQMFDSQNGRGKELEAYNLLKAYHIRAMESDAQETKIECDKRWESSTNYKREPSKESSQGRDILKQVINEQLYRSRKWSRKNNAYDFTKNEISEFKGFTIDKHNSIAFSFQNSQLLQYIAIKYWESAGLTVKGVKSRFNNGDSENINPFVLVNQSIINGKHFFDYIETYIEIYKQLFINLEGDILKEFKQFYKKYCKNYSGANRLGDRYLKEVYKSLIFIIFDKFGERGVIEYYKTLYVLIYRLRLEKKQVKYNPVAQYPLNFFASIEESNNLNLKFLRQEANKEIKCEKEVKEIIPVFFEYGTVITNIDLSEYGK